MLEGRCQRKRRMIGLLSEAREAPGWRLSFPISDTCRYMVALTPPLAGEPHLWDPAGPHSSLLCQGINS